MREVNTETRQCKEAEGGSWHRKPPVWCNLYKMHNLLSARLQTSATAESSLPLFVLLHNNNITTADSWEDAALKMSRPGPVTRKSAKSEYIETVS